MTVDTSTPMDRAEAQRITERIRVALDRVSQSWADLGERITEAYQRRADLALGYSSWAEYAEAELKPTEGLAAEVRRQLVGMLSQAGMSSRSIAPVVDMTDRGVRKSVAQQVGTEFPPSPKASGGSTGTTSLEGERIDPVTGEVLTEAPTPTLRFDVNDALRRGVAAAEEASKVTGLDGKSYPKLTPEPAAPRRRPLTDGFRDAALDLFKITGRFERLVGDDRFARNKNEVARYANDLTHARDALQRVIEQLTS